VLGEDPVALAAGQRVEFESREAGMGREAIDVLRPAAETPRHLWPVLTGTGGLTGA
jgi:hypothetical protein